MTFASATLMLTLILDPFGNLPLFASALRGVPPERRRRVLVRELLFALAILVAFLFAGGTLLRLLGLSTPSVGIAGGAVLLFLAFQMLFPRRTDTTADAEPEPFLVPLAVPLVAGPAVLSALLLLTNEEPGRTGTWLGALVVAWGFSAAVLLSSNVLARVLGERGLSAVERLMGMLLAMLAVQMLLEGLRAALA